MPHLEVPDSSRSTDSESCVPAITNSVIPDLVSE